MRTSSLPLVIVACVACSTKQPANRPDTTAPAAATAAATSTSPNSTAELKRIVDSVQTKYIEAVVKGDAAALSGFFTDDAVVLAPNVKASHGRAEMDASNAKMLAAMKFTGLKLHTDDLQVFGDVGVETGSYEQTLQPKGKTLHDTGNYLAVWKKQSAGGWKIYRLAYDSELTAPKS